MLEQNMAWKRRRKNRLENKEKTDKTECENSKNIGTVFGEHEFDLAARQNLNHLILKQISWDLF